jgi:hypothetical protein
MTCKGTTRMSASICMGSVQYVSMEEDDVAWIRWAGYFWILTGNDCELVDGSILVRSGIVVKDAFQ